MSATTRPRASLGRILEDLGATLLDVAAGPVNHEAVIDTVLIHDVLDDAMPMRGALVLGVGIANEEDIIALLHTLRAQQAIALVLRAPVKVSAELTAAVTEAGIPVLALTRGASWAQLTAVVRSLIAEGDVGDSDAQTLGGMPAGDLFALANAVSTLVDAPVTIEDRNSRVLAFSGRQDEADPPRIETILGRQVPEKYMRQLEDRGVFQLLYRSEDPIDVDPIGTDGPSIPRVALAVRAGDEILGSIWVAVEEALSVDRVRALKDAAKLVALHMMRLRAGADVERRVRADLLATLLEGGSAAADAATKLRLQDHSCVVLAVGSTDPADDAGGETPEARLIAERQRFADAFAMHLGAVYQRSAVAPLGNLVYAIVGVHSDVTDADTRAERVANDFLTRLSGSDRLLVGVGTIANDLATIPRSRRDADRALRVLREEEHRGPVARFTSVQVEALLVELADLATAKGDQPTGPVALLIAHDRERGSHLVQTLRAWLDAFGDVTVAAATVFTHPNTFRYRLRRLSEISGLDLGDPDARFSAMVQLRLLGSDAKKLRD